MSLVLLLALMFALSGCRALAGVKFGVCYEDVCVSAELPSAPPITIETDSGK